MNRSLAAVCAAVALTFSLTACTRNSGTTTTPGVTTPDTTTPSTTVPDTTVPDTVDPAPEPGIQGNDTTVPTPSGTNYTVPRQTRYPAGANLDRNSYNRMTSYRSGYDGANDGRYTAYSDGTVASGRDDAGQTTQHIGRDAIRGTRSFSDRVGDAVRDIGNGAGNAVRNAGNGVGNAVKDIAGTK